MRRVAGEVRDDTVRGGEVKDLEDGIVGGLVLCADDGIVQAGFFDGAIVLKYGFAVQTEPGIGRVGYRDFDFGVCPHVQVDLFLVVGAEPQLPLVFQAEHERTAFGFTVAADSGQILDGICGQEFYNFVHEKYLQMGLQLDLRLAWI